MRILLFLPQSISYYNFMEVGDIQTTAPIKKRFCCGAAKRLKEKCLRFNQSQEKCIDFIKGHEECIAVKRKYEGRELQATLGQ